MSLSRWRSVLCYQLHKTILSCTFASKSSLFLDKQSRYDVIWMWDRDCLVAGNAPRFLLCPMVRPCTTLGSAQETGRNRATTSLPFLSFPLITCSWQHRNRMRQQAKALRSRKTCCKLQLISGKTASTTQISWVPVCCCGSWATSVPMGSYAVACNRGCHPDLYF